MGVPEPIEGEDISGVSPVHRFRNTNTGVHLYTAYEEEIAAVFENPNYVSEGISYYAYDNPVEGTEAAYRFYNPGLDAHFYTSNADQKDVYLNSPDFQLEGDKNGIAFHVQPAEI